MRLSVSAADSEYAADLDTLRSRDAPGWQALPASGIGFVSALWLPPYVQERAGHGTTWLVEALRTAGRKACHESSGIIVSTPLEMRNAT